MTDTTVTATSFATADGVRLAGDLARGPQPSVALVVAHPHPRYGGDRHNVVVDAVFRAAAEAGAAVLRFDFRGAGDSDGDHGGGRAERLDLEAALATLQAAAPRCPLVLTGYSFGAAVALTVDDPSVAAWVAIAPPLGPLLGFAPTVGDDERPKLLLVAEHDQFCPPESAAAATDGWRATTIEPVPGGDHFLAGQARHVGARVVACMEEIAGGR